MLALTKSAVQIRRKFLQDVSGHVDAELNCKSPSRVGRVPIVRVVGVGNGNGGRITADFREVELSFAVVAVSQEDLTHGVPEPGPRAPRTAPEVSRVLMEQGWIYPFGHYISDHEVAIRRPVIATVTCHPLAVGWRGIRRLTDTRKKARKKKRSGVERITSRYFEFFS